MRLPASRLPPIVPPNDGTAAEPNLATLIPPYDPPDIDWQRWLPGQDTSSGNEVIAYIDGAAAFRDMAAAIRTATGPAHFIYLLAWNTEDFHLVPADPRTLLSTLLADASARGVPIRAMLYKHNQWFPSKDNTPAVDMINALPTGAAIHDQRVLPIRPLGIPQLDGKPVGSHHQKVLIVFGTAGLVAFQGGVDLDPNRLTHGAGPGLHDVHTRVMGPAAQWLHRILIERWLDHPEAAQLPGVRQAVPAPRHPDSDLFVHVARTYGNGTRYPMTPPYAFAPTGEQTAKSLLLHAIRTASRFIYVEDQYLVDLDVSRALVAALPQIQKLVILVCDAGAVVKEILQVGRRRKEFLDPLHAVAPDKVHVCTSSRYIHAKAWIFDDRFAIIGSANVNRRGLSHDSEQLIGVFDVNARHRWYFAHELRMHLWARHLGLRPLEVIDAVAASVHWASGSTRGEVRPYVADPTTDEPLPWLGGLVFSDNRAWDAIIDPDGT